MPFVNVSCQLLMEKESAVTRIKEVKEIALSDLQIGIGQVRLREVSKEIDELADSIRQVGLLEPIVVCETEMPGKYEIVTGQRRFMAHQELQMESIMAAVLEERVDETTAKVLSVTENLVRRDLNSADLVDVCTYLYHKYGSIRIVSDETGLPYSKVSQHVKYDQLIEPLKELVDTGLPILTALRAQRAAAVGGEVNQEEAVKFAKEMSPMSGAQQSKIVTTRSQNPEMTADDIIEDAKAGGKITQVVVTLSSEVHGALTKYAHSEGTNSNDAAGMLIRSALYDNDLLEDRE